MGIRQYLRGQVDDFFHICFVIDLHSTRQGCLRMGVTKYIGGHVFQNLIDRYRFYVVGVPRNGCHEIYTWSFFENLFCRCRFYMVGVPQNDF